MNDALRLQWFESRLEIRHDRLLALMGLPKAETNGAAVRTWADITSARMKLTSGRRGEWEPRPLGSGSAAKEVRSNRSLTVAAPNGRGS